MLFRVPQSFLSAQSLLLRTLSEPTQSFLRASSEQLRSSKLIRGSSEILQSTSEQLHVAIVQLAPIGFRGVVGGRCSAQRELRLRA